MPDKTTSKARRGASNMSFIITLWTQNRYPATPLPRYPATPLPRYPITCEIEGKTHTGTYWVAGKILTVSTGLGGGQEQTGWNNGVRSPSKTTTACTGQGRQGVTHVLSRVVWLLRSGQWSMSAVGSECAETRGVKRAASFCVFRLSPAVKLVLQGAAIETCEVD